MTTINVAHAADSDSATTTEAESAALLPQPVPVRTQEPVVVGLDDYPDPLEPVNRIVFVFNDMVYRGALIPLGKAYGRLPKGARQGVSRFFFNLREPVNLINHVAQGRVGQAGKNLFRFLTNTTLGLAGLFDPADKWFGVSPQVSRFNDTFRTWGIGNGPYLVLPFAGPTDLRGGAGSVIDSTLHPVRWVTEDPETTVIIVFDNFQRFAPRAGAYLELRAASEDPYIYFRNQYLQGVARDAAFPAVAEDQAPAAGVRQAPAAGIQ